MKKVSIIVFTLFLVVIGFFAFSPSSKAQETTVFTYSNSGNILAYDSPYIIDYYENYFGSNGVSTIIIRGISSNQFVLTGMASVDVDIDFSFSGMKSGLWYNGTGKSFIDIIGSGLTNLPNVLTFHFAEGVQDDLLINLKLDGNAQDQQHFRNNFQSILGLYIQNNFNIDGFVKAVREAMAVDIDNSLYTAGYLDGLNEGQFQMTSYYAYVVGSTYYTGDEAYSMGYLDGLNANDNDTVRVFGLVSGSLMSSVGKFVGFEILPGFSVGLLILIPVVFGLIAFIVRGKK